MTATTQETRVRAAEPDLAYGDDIDPLDLDPGDGDWRPADHIHEDEDDEPAPDEHDPYWDELTDDTFAHLRRIRADHRSQERGDKAFILYVITLFVGGYGGLFALHLVERAADNPGGPAIGPWTAALAPMLMGGASLALLVMGRSARWAGPVLLDAPTVSWLLPHPVRWERLLRPKFRAVLIKGGASGAVVGAFLGLTPFLAGAGESLPGLGAGVAAGAVFGVLTVAAAVLIETRPAMRQGRWSLPLAALTLMFAVQALLAWRGIGSSWWRTVDLWSGPWGWCVRVLTDGAAGDLGIAWGLALVLLLAVTVAVAVRAHHELRLLSGESLRTRSRTVQGVTGAVNTVDLRAARLATRSAVRRGGRASWYLRRGPLAALLSSPPRRAVLLVPWRDAVGLASAPSQLAWTVVWWACGLTAATIMATTDATVATAASLIVTLVAGYLAAGSLTEPARTDSDDLRRSRLLPYTYQNLMLLHSLLPIVLLAALGGLGVGALALWGLPLAPGVVMLMAVPAWVTAALVSANRGSMPQSLFVGEDTMWGNTSPLKVVLWHSRAPLALGAVLAFAVFQIGRGPATAQGWSIPSVLCVAAAGIGFWWVEGRAGRLYRDAG
ncbi:DUF6297 family protein [Streptomyces tsukubensis]|uniref:Uncharacterized protein n=1 Tax=Streptomyces tsukubensis TaxID=83656 RepID=A0A1V4AAN1_9ACTN|nr:DUF6297 family protein [Streptomyces tsukubensis]OON80880.1 hypothetical protein B1H18_10905 [Streptomyces tsukubensis]QFR93475.1 hypothetical protein GBW32_10760 [Streptomyces tsukubensis]